MIWLYNFDPKAIERQNVSHWMKTEILEKEREIILNPIVPLEVIHALSKNPKVEYTVAYNTAVAIVALETVKVVDLTSEVMYESFLLLGKFREWGIGGRDATMFATMEAEGTTTIATHDKNVLMVPAYRRIDPVFSPPLVMEAGEAIDKCLFRERLKELES